MCLSMRATAWTSTLLSALGSCWEKVQGTVLLAPAGAAELYYFPIEDVRSWLAPRPDADGKEKTRAAAAAARAAVEAPARPEDAALPSPAKSATAKARRSGAGKEQALGQSRAPGTETATKPRRAPAAPAGAAAPQRRQQQEQRESAAAGGVEHGGEELQAGQPGAAASGQQQQGAEGVGAGPEGEPAPAGISSGGEASILDESGEVGVEDSGDSGAGASEGEELLPAKGEEEVLDDRPAKRQRTQGAQLWDGEMEGGFDCSGAEYLCRLQTLLA